MKKLFLPLIVLSVFFLFGCKTTYVGGYSATPSISINYDLKADLKIDTTKVLQATSATKVYFGLIKVGDRKFSDAFGGKVGDREKSAATYKALEGTGFDIIVNPKYLVTLRRGFFVSKIEATVAGYGAKIYLK